MKQSEGPERRPVEVIAEMACSHEGDPELARVIIDGAGSAGADAIQFQIWRLTEHVVPQHPDYALLERLELEPTTWRELAEYSRSKHPDMEIIACVYESTSVDLCVELGIGTFKVHSSDLSNPEFLEYVAEHASRIDLSTGASTLSEIQAAVQRIEDVSPAVEIVLMHGHQSFPTDPSDVNLDMMMKLAELFELPVGYQDHSDPESGASFLLPAAAVGMGVDVLEKHITHDRSKKGVDHQAALNPDEFAAFVDMVDTVLAGKGSSVPGPFSESELRYRKYSKKSLVAGRPIEPGTRLVREDLLVRRGDTLGIAPDRLEDVVGRVADRELAPFEVITEDVFR